MKKLFFLFLFLSVAKFSFSTHLMGGEITWKCIKSGTDIGKYNFNMKVYRDCSGTTVGTFTQDIQVWNHPTVTSIPVEFVLSQDVSPPCDPMNSSNAILSCANGDPGSVEEYIFETLIPVSLPGVPPVDGWIFTWDNCCRNGAITNLINPSSEGFTLRASMFPYIDPTTGLATPADPCFDSSPDFKEQPKTILCTGFPFSYSHNAFDDELDDLVYSWAEPLDDFFTTYNYPIDPIPLPFDPPYSVNVPLPGNPILNSTTGEVTYDANIAGNFVTCIKVQSFKCNQLVSEIYREVQVVLLACPSMPASTLPNNPPVVAAPFTDASSTIASYDTIVYAGALVEFNIDGIDNDLYNNTTSQSLTMEVSGGQFSDDYVNTTNCSNPPCATFNNGAGLTPPFSNPGLVSGVFSWQTSCSHIAATAGCGQTSNVFNFLVKVYDDFCPANGISFSNISITVLPSPVDNSPDFRCVSVLPNNNIEVSWSHLAGAPPSTVYSVFHSDNANGPFVFLDSVLFPLNNYSDIANAGNITKQYYYLSSHSSCADESLPSDTLSSIYLSVDAINGDTEGDMNWNNIHNPILTSSQNFNIMALDGNNSWLNVGNTPNNNFIFPAQTCDSYQFLYVELPDASGCSSLSNINGANLKDTISPNNPIIKDVSVDNNGNSVISWTSSSNDVDVYAIYILDEFGSWITIDSVFGFNNNSYNYNNSNANSQFETFSIRSIDSCGNSSGRSIEHNSILVNSYFDACDLSIKINWNPYININNGLSHYKVFINETDNQNNTTYDSIRINNLLEYKIENLNESSNYYFYVAAYNSDSTIKAISNQNDYDIILPNRPEFNYINFASVNHINGDVDISLYVDDQAVISHYNVYRSFQDDSLFNIIGNINFNNSSTLNYSDNTAETYNTFYEYQIYPVDTCNNIITVGSIIQNNDITYAKTIFLESKINLDYSDNLFLDEQYTNTISLNEYENWLGNVSEYQLFRSINREPFDLLPLYTFDRVNNPNEELIYIDVVTEFGEGNGRFCYYIKAIEGFNNPYGSSVEGSLSNISCVSQTPILFLPNTFTPNGDEHNEIFKPVTNFVSDIGYVFSIYSRNGENIFSTNDPRKGWDGTFNGRFVKNDNYVYHVSYINGVAQLTEKTGSFNLIR